MIKRYDPIGYDNLSAYVEENDEGDYVKYEDHLEIVKKLEERIAELENIVEDLEVSLREANEDIDYYESQPYID